MELVPTKPAHAELNVSEEPTEIVPSMHANPNLRHFESLAEVSVDEIDIDGCPCNVAATDGARHTANRITFTLGVTNALLMAFLTGGYHYLLPIVYTVKAPLLILGRVYFYWLNSMHYFCIEFCYFANLLLLLYLWVWNSEASLFTVLFAVANGPMAFAVVVFRNALVFHSLDKVTSIFIHLTPVLVSYAVRWYAAPMATAGFSWQPVYAVCAPDDSSCCNPVLLLVLPCALFAAHQVFLLLFTGWLCPMPEGKEYLNSFRYLAGDKRGMLHSATACCGSAPWKKVVVFGVLNIVYTFLTLLPSLLLYRSWHAHLAFIMLITMVAAYNGSHFYFDKRKSGKGRAK
jgi:hypothetical protein